MGRRRRESASAPDATGRRCPMPQSDDLSRSPVPLHQDSTLIAVVELSQSSWPVAGIVPGLARHPLKKLEPDPEALLRLLRRWRDEAARARSEEHTSELQSRQYLVCRLLLEKKKKRTKRQSEL